MSNGTTRRRLQLWALSSTLLHRHDTKQQARLTNLEHITHLEALAASVEAWSVNTFTATVCTPPMVALYTCTAQQHVD